MKLTNDDLQEIVRLLDSSFASELRIKTESFDLYLRRTGAGWTQETHTLTAPHIEGGGTTDAAMPAPADAAAPAD